MLPDALLPILDAFGLGNRWNVFRGRLVLVACEAKNGAVLDYRLSAKAVRDYVVIVILPEREFDRAALAIRLTFAKTVGSIESRTLNLLGELAAAHHAISLLVALDWLPAAVVPVLLPSAAGVFA